jgi:hypothetical protein
MANVRRVSLAKWRATDAAMKGRVYRDCLTQRLPCGPWHYLESLGPQNKYFFFLKACVNYHRMIVLFNFAGRGNPRGCLIEGIVRTTTITILHLLVLLHQLAMPVVGYFGIV